MQKGRFAVVLGLAVAAASTSFSFSTSARADANSDEVAKLKAKGDALGYSVKTTEPASSIDTGGAMILINAPIATVRKIVQDYGHYNQTMPGFTQSQVLSKKKGTSEVYLSVGILHGAMTIWAVSTLPPPVKDGDGEKIVSQFEKGNVSDFRATWRLRAVDADHTVLKLEVLVDPKLPLPASKITAALTSAADSGVTQVREKAQATPAAQQPVASVDAKKTGDAAKK